VTTPDEDAPEGTPVLRRAWWTLRSTSRVVAVAALVGLTGVVLHRMAAPAAEEGGGPSAVRERMRRAVEDSRTEPPPKPHPLEGSRVVAPTDDPVPGMLLVESRPTGATVRIGEAILGTTPLVTTMDVLGDGGVVQVVAPGHRPWRQSVRPSSEGVRITAVLEAETTTP
jgi:hypothetical protein